MNLGLSKQQKIQCSQQQFFKIMDIIQPYDKLMTDLNNAYNQAIIQLSYLKFQNVDTSVNSKGFKVTPALISINNQFELKLRIQNNSKENEQNKKSNQIQSFDKNKTCIRFSEQIDEIEEQYQQQQAIQQQLSRLLSNIKNLDKDSEQVQEIFINRFNVLNNRKLVKAACKKFKIFLNKCCEALKQRKIIIQQLEKIQKQRI